MGCGSSIPGYLDGAAQPTASDQPPKEALLAASVEASHPQAPLATKVLKKWTHELRDFQQSCKEGGSDWEDSSRSGPRNRVLRLRDSLEQDRPWQTLQGQSYGTPSLSLPPSAIDLLPVALTCLLDEMRGALACDAPGFLPALELASLARVLASILFARGEQEGPQHFSLVDLVEAKSQIRSKVDEVRHVAAERARALEQAGLAGTDLQNVASGGGVSLRCWVGRGEGGG